MTRTQALRHVLKTDRFIRFLAIWVVGFGLVLGILLLRTHGLK